MGLETVAVDLWIAAGTVVSAFWAGLHRGRKGRGGRRQQDVERLHVEAELRANAARLRMMLETTAEGVIGIDDEARVMFANRAAAQILGWSQSAELMGRPAGDVLGHRLSDGSPCHGDVCAIQRTLVDSETRRVSNETFRNASGRPIAVEYVSSPLVVEGITIGAVVAFHDISDRKRLEEDLRRSHAELEQFAYVTSHDLRQPLRMVSSYLALIRKRLDDRLGDDEREFIGYAVDGAKRMDALILDLLDYSRVGHDQSRDTVALAEVIEDVRHNLSVTLADCGGRLNVAADLPEVDGNRMELMRLFQNLIGNALKYRHPERAPEVAVGWRDDGQEWVVWVQDNGVGIATCDHERAFRIFQRLAASRQVEGTGIGLAICRKIVDHHDGRIWIESEMDQGTRMLVAFPKHGLRRSPVAALSA
ncbi:Signal transduction histidine kinase (fragment) [Magnetospirillum sp. LM-5]|uniref:sensor histidine kinase n=1 Tax=Magnetospirillum sp. LM-5 TaxID=2681466 RepID=UPI0013828D16